MSSLILPRDAKSCEGKLEACGAVPFHGFCVGLKLSACGLEGLLRRRVRIVACALDILICGRLKGSSGRRGLLYGGLGPQAFSWLRGGLGAGYIRSDFDSCGNSNRGVGSLY